MSDNTEDIKEEDIRKTSSEKPEYTTQQLYAMSGVYEFMAKALPTEGRDYDVNFSFTEGNMSLAFKHHTELGKWWCEYCYNLLKEHSK